MPTRQADAFQCRAHVVMFLQVLEPGLRLICAAQAVVWVDVLRDYCKEHCKMNDHLVLGENQTVALMMMIVVAAR